VSPGSVIVDLAAEQGGNCALTERDQVVSKFGVTIIGLTDLASRLARQSSDLYARTAFNLVEDVIEPGRGLAIDLQDEIHRGVLVVHEGRITWPPPAPPVRAAAPPAAAAATTSRPAAASPATHRG